MISKEGTGVSRVYTQIEHSDPMLFFNSTLFWQDERGDLTSLPYPHQMGEMPKIKSIAQPINILIISSLLQPPMNDPCENSKVGLEITYSSTRAFG